MVKKVGCVNGDEVPNFLEAYKAKMMKRDVDEEMRQKYFCWVAAVSMHKEVKDLEEAHEKWESFQETY